MQIVDTYICPSCTLWVSKSLDIWCVFDRISNFEKCNLRSGHLMWPGGVTFEVRRSNFLSNVSKCLMNSYAKFVRATRRGLFAIHEKPEGGADNRPPAVHGLNYGKLQCYSPKALLWLKWDKNIVCLQLCKRSCTLLGLKNGVQGVHREWTGNVVNLPSIFRVGSTLFQTRWRRPVGCLDDKYGWLLKCLLIFSIAYE